MRKTFAAIAAFCALMTGAALMQLKLAVQEQADKVAALADQIHQDQEGLRILEAEWAYLTSPQALQEQSLEFLALMPPTPRQVIETTRDIPLRRSDEVVSEDSSVLLPTAQTPREKPADDKANVKDKRKEAL